MASSTPWGDYRHLDRGGAADASSHLEIFRRHLVLAHGGAALPMVLGRLAKAHDAHPAGPADPTESFARLYFDTVVFDVETAASLCAMAGIGKVVLGTDYPFPICDCEPMKSSMR